MDLSLMALVMVVTFREILMTASPNIKTPSMDVPLLQRAAAEEDGRRLKRIFTRVCLNEVRMKVTLQGGVGKGI